ncbi:MAG: hypothetical protein ABH952_08860 [Candidatus Omnitrophota bacterium]
MKHIFFVVAVLMVVFLTAAVVNAAVPHLIRFQGKVTDKDGAPLNGAYNITFRIYDAASGGTLKWSETQSAIPVNNGIFTVLLGNVNSLDLPFDVPYWLSMEVNNDGEMAPRQQITSVGYAIHAETADNIADVAVIPSGAIIIMTGTSCPAGYTRMAELDNRFLMGGTTYQADAGGSQTHTHSAGGYNVANHKHGAGTYAAGAHQHNAGGLYVNDHVHNIPATATVWGLREGNHESLGVASKDMTYAAANDYPTGEGGGQYVQGVTDWNWGVPVNGESGDAGAQGVSGISGSADSRPPFATVIFCRKD